MIPYYICDFSQETISNLIQQRFGSDFPDINQKPQVRFIFNYLKKLQVKTVLLESDYVDRDYLDDYARYYVQCFKRYGERCARLHFFGLNFDHDNFRDYLETGEATFTVKERDSNGSEITVNITLNKGTLQDSYAGFVTIKPIPRTFIGKTCLSVYPTIDAAARKHVIKKDYSVNLFGTKLTVKSIPFQEQDKILSACATASIWNALHASTHHAAFSLPSPSEITLISLDKTSKSVNVFPNNGLTNQQIISAFDGFGLRCHLIKINPNEKKIDFLNLISSYIDSSIPIILGMDVYIKDEKTPVGHAVTALGCDFEESVLYIHDDRIGPYARARIMDQQEINVIEPSSESSNNQQNKLAITIQHKGQNGTWEDSEEVAVLTTIFVPTHKKVRINRSTIENTFINLRTGIESLEIKTRPRFSWKITLRSLEQIRQKIVDSNVLRKYKSLTKNMARFQWEVELSIDNAQEQGPIASILFDATEIPQGNPISDILIYEETYFLVLEKVIKALPNEKLAPSANSFYPQLISFFKKQEASSHLAHLTSRFGEIRAPKYLKNEEVSALENNTIQTSDYIHAYHPDDLNGETLDGIYARVANSSDILIWAISEDGALLLGPDRKNMGHPLLTRFKGARIAGELHKKDGNAFSMNSRSGRYSRFNDAGKKSTYLTNAKNMMSSFFPQEEIVIDENYPQKAAI